MKKIIKYFLLVSITSPMLMSSCKKGVDDPFISLHTRKARVTGEWKMKSGTSTEMDFNSSTQTTYTTTNTYDGNNVVEAQTISNSSGSSTSTNTYTYTENFNFKKDGTFSINTVYDGISNSSQGKWNFSSRIGDKKNKSELVLIYTQTINNGVTYNYEGLTNTEVYYIKELRNDKMVLTRTFEYSDSSGDTGSGESSITLEQ